MHLQDITAHLRRLDAHDGRPLWAAQARRELRHEPFRLWRAWLTVCERLRLHPRVHAAMGEALEAAWDAAGGSRPGGLSGLDAGPRSTDAAKAQMMVANLRLVIHIAMHFRNRGVPVLDLIQEGNLGLMRRWTSLSHVVGSNLSPMPTGGFARPSAVR